MPWRFSALIVFFLGYFSLHALAQNYGEQSIGFDSAIDLADADDNLIELDQVFVESSAFTTGSGSNNFADMASQDFGWKDTSALELFSGELEEDFPGLVAIIGKGELRKPNTLGIFDPFHNGPLNVPPRGGGPITNPPSGLALVIGALRNAVGRGACDQLLLEDYSKINITGAMINIGQRDIFDAFQYNCLPPLPKATSEISLNDMALLNSLMSIRDRVVILENTKTNSHQCTGLAVDTDLVLTAAHCFATSSAPRFKLDLSNLTEYRATALDGRNSSVKAVIAFGSDLEADSLTKSVSRERLDEDVVLIRLSSPIVNARFAPKAFSEDLVAETPLFLFGRRSHGSPSSKEKVVVVRNQACRLHFDAKQHSGRLFYQCVTEPGMSGGPVFAQASNKRLYFVGIHQAGAVISDIEGVDQRTPPRCVLKAFWCNTELKSHRFLNVGHIVSIVEYLEEFTRA